MRILQLRKLGLRKSTQFTQYHTSMTVREIIETQSYLTLNPY